MKRTTPLSRSRLIESRDGARRGAQKLFDRAKLLLDIAERHQKELDDDFYI